MADILNTAGSRSSSLVAELLDEPLAPAALSILSIGPGGVCVALRDAPIERRTTMVDRINDTHWI